MVGVIVVGSLVDVHRHEFRIEMWSLKGGGLEDMLRRIPGIIKTLLSQLAGCPLPSKTEQVIAIEN